QTMRTEWTELALLQLQTGNTAMWVFLLAVVLVFLVLAAQYESWALPLAVILVVPMCLLCAVAGLVMARMDINIFTQVGFLVLVGLAGKNAIPIVEYGKAQRQAGQPRPEATPAEASPVAHFITNLNHGLGELDGHAAAARGFSRDQLETLERGLNTIQQLLEKGRNGG